GERVVELVAEDADEALPGLAFLFAQGAAHVGEHEELQGQSSLAKSAAPRLPPSGAAGQGKVEDARRARVEALRETQLRGQAAQQLLLRPSEQALARAVGQPEPVLAVEREDRDVDLLHHLAQESGRLEGAQALLAQRLRQRVDL